MTKKMVSFRMETELLDKLNRLKESKTDVIQKALELYLQNLKECNTPHKENVNTECNTNVNTVNQVAQKVNHEVDQVNSSVQIVENYELLRHYKEEIDRLRDRIEYFEEVCKALQHDARSDTKTEKETAVSLYRM